MPVTNIPVLTIIYETKYGEAPNSISYEGGGYITLSASDLPEITDNGHRFVGWSYNGEAITEDYEIYVVNDMTITLVAVWEEQKTYVLADKSDIIAIADQLRTLTDKTEDMSLSQMTTEVSNANTAKNDILSALVDKGVDTTGAGLSNIAGLVTGIQSGGVTTGTIVPSNYTNILNFGVPIPEDDFFVAILPFSTTAATLGPNYIYHGYYTKIGGNEEWFSQGSSPQAGKRRLPTFNRTDNTVTFDEIYLQKAVEYIWFMGRIAT